MTCATKTTHNPEVIDDRVEQFSDLGFTVEEAKVLAEARKDDGTYWRTNEVQQMLGQRATHQQLVRIFRPLPQKYDPEIGLPDEEYEVRV